MATNSLLVLKKSPTGFFWSAPFALDSDFTAEDPLALDYLGQQVGNWLFRGFTTRTSRAQYYAVVLYGLYLANTAIETHGSADDKKLRQLFERWERFWALATVESRDGELGRGDPDAMRGVRGATKEWSNGDKPLRLDFPLISRQLELGGLGAYLTSLREYKMVSPGTMRKTLAADEIIDNFWGEPGQKLHRQEEYAMFAIDLNNPKLPRQHNGLTLKRIGETSRLSSITGRPKQQERLWQILFETSKDGSTLALSNQLIAAAKEGLSDSEELLEGMLSGRWGSLNSDCVDKVSVAIAFGRLAKFLLGCFNRAYQFVEEHGWAAGMREVAAVAFPDSELGLMNSLCKALLDAKYSLHFNPLQPHGPQFLGLVKKLIGADRNICLEHLLSFHRAVQKSRHGTGSWLLPEQSKLTMNMKVAGYNGYKSAAEFPSFKLGVVRQLLKDLGKLK